jgi:hypothetical protein
VSNILNITTSDLELAYEGSLDGSRTPYYQYKIDQAVRKLAKDGATRGWDLAAGIAAGDLDAEYIKDVVLLAVSRVISNPEGLMSESENGYSYQRNPNVASGELRFWPSELDDIFPLKPKRVRRAVSHQQNYGGWGMPG